MVVWFCKCILNLSVMLQLAGETALCLTTMSTQNFGLIEPSGSTTVYLFGAVHRTETLYLVPENISPLQGRGVKIIASAIITDFRHGALYHAQHDYYSPLNLIGKSYGL